MRKLPPHAFKRMLTWQITEAMEVKGLTTTAMARHMKISCAQLDRLLDLNNEKVQLAASAVGRTLRIKLA
ncbi:XRE family transcriptional regulator [Nitrosococcus oceani]|uniref:XRE family transcriptional regulator n=1 Tax=Nitrosococcus oceani TaxID=1229 RepID=UPI0003141668|nr:XRE family transcriptional regulator [Nitrosococcus oceani]GEM20975.1 hypothetical protein NONS58_24010 [Nitrosococcus oceani]